MEPLLQFLLALAIIVFAAKAFGYLSAQWGQPAVLGELLIGLILGPTVLDMLHWPAFWDAHLGETLSHLAHLGVLLLMFVAGLEVDLETMTRSGRPAVWAGALGALVPVGLGALAALPFGYGWREGLFIGLMLAATSVSISAQTMLELGVLQSRVGMALLGAAVVDDVLVILLLSTFTALIAGTGGGALSVLGVTVRMLLFLVLATLVGMRFFSGVAQRVDRLPISEGVVSLAVVIILTYAWAAEVLGGVAAITGAFLAGLAFARSPLRHHLETRMHTLAYAWLVPVFFVNIGLEANARAIGVAGLPFALLILLAAVLSKVVGCGVGGLLGHLSPRESLILGVGMISRGEVGLIVASLGLSAGLIGEEVFASIVVMVLVTTLVTPILLRLLYRKRGESPDAG